MEKQDSKYQITAGIPMSYDRKVLSYHKTKREAMKEARRLRRDTFYISLQIETTPRVVWKGWRDK